MTGGILGGVLISGLTAGGMLCLTRVYHDFVGTRKVRTAEDARCIASRWLQYSHCCCFRNDETDLEERSEERPSDFYRPHELTYVELARRSQ